MSTGCYTPGEATFDTSELADSIKRQAPQVVAEVPKAPDDFLFRASVGIPDQPPLDWLNCVSDEMRFYGSARGNKQAIEIGGVGTAHELVWHEPARFSRIFNALRSSLQMASQGVRFYGGFRFTQEAKPDVDWKVFGFSRFIVPRLEMIRSERGNLFSLHFTAAEYANGHVDYWCDRIASMCFWCNAWSDQFPPPLSRQENPDYSGWEENIEESLRAFDAGQLDKVVLARRADFLFGGNLDPIVLLHRLKSATPDCFHFCYMPAKDIAFVGASPERLYMRDDRRLETEAVAGTRMRGKTQELDDELGNEMLNSDKDRREHEIVRSGIRDQLSPLCDAFKMDASPRLQKLARGQHLYSHISAQLRDEVRDEDILAALHPTAALGGQPRETALAFIERLEAFDRGWYAAPVGWVAEDSAEFAVAIRSGLVQPNKLSLFSGAGIVAGSTAANEWEEIELKVRDFIKVLTAS